VSPRDRGRDPFYKYYYVIKLRNIQFQPCSSCW